MNTVTINKNVLVLDNDPYKENDGRIRIADEQGIYTVTAKGVQKLTSKNRLICQPFSRVTMTLHDQNGYYSLLYGNTQKYYYHIPQDLIMQTTCSLIHEILRSHMMDSFLIMAVENMWKSFDQQDGNGYTWACICLRDILMKEGIAPYIDGCVQCGTTRNLETLSLPHGGFLCRNCNHGQFMKQTKEELIRIYSLFHVREDRISDFCNTYTWTIDDILEWAEWYQYYMHTQIHSLQFLKTIR